MTLIAWIIFKIKKTEDGKPTKAGIWLAIVLAAVIIWYRSFTNSNGHNNTYTTSNCPYYCFKCCWWNYIWMALLEERTGISHDISFFCRYRAARNTIYSIDVKH